MGSWKKSKEKQSGIPWPVAFQLLIALTTPIVGNAVSKALALHWQWNCASKADSPWMAIVGGGAA